MNIPDNRNSDDKLIEKLAKIKVNKSYNVKSIVGKRMSVRWPDKKYYKGLVIGFTTTLSHNLIFYDNPTHLTRRGSVFPRDIADVPLLIFYRHRLYRQYHLAGVL